MTALVNPVAIGLGVVTIALVVAFLRMRSRRDQVVDLGAVSSQWVMEHRMGPGQDTSRWNQR